MEGPAQIRAVDARAFYNDVARNNCRESDELIYLTDEDHAELLAFDEEMYDVAAPAVVLGGLSEEGTR